MNVIQHTRSCLSLYWVAVYFNQPCVLYIAFGTLFLHLWRSSCKIFVHYMSNSWRTISIGIQLHALGKTIKLGFGGNLGRCMDSWSWAQTLPFYKNASSLVFSESEKGNHLVGKFLQVGRQSNESVVQQEWNTCIRSSIRLFVRFDWRNFPLELAARISIAELPFLTFSVITSTSGTMSNVYHSSMLLVINMDVERGHMSYAHALPNKK